MFYFFATRLLPKLFSTPTVPINKQQWQKRLLPSSPSVVPSRLHAEASWHLKAACLLHFSPLPSHASFCKEEWGDSPPQTQQEATTKKRTTKWNIYYRRSRLPLLRKNSSDWNAAKPKFRYATRWQCCQTNEKKRKEKKNGATSGFWLRRIHFPASKSMLRAEGIATNYPLLFKWSYAQIFPGINCPVSKGGLGSERSCRLEIPRSVQNLSDGV